MGVQLIKTSTTVDSPLNLHDTAGADGNRTGTLGRVTAGKNNTPDHVVGQMVGGKSRGSRRQDCKCKSIVSLVYIGKIHIFNLCNR